MVYMITASYTGLNGELEKKIAERAKRRCVGAGYAPWENRRDVDFYFNQRPAAYRAAARIRSLRGVNARVTAFDRPWDGSE